jgi:hypothetical protein
VFGIPVIATSFDEAVRAAEKLPYAVYSIQYRYIKTTTTTDVTEYYLFGGGERVDRVERNERNERNERVERVERNERNERNERVERVERNNNNIKLEIIEKAEKVDKVNKPDKVEKQETIKVSPPQSSTNTRLFYIKPDLQNDIYYLYDTKAFTLSSLEGSSIISKNIAHIPDYKTSVLMNKLFRNIKENVNLDALEESDDEEEFENIQIDKFVDLNKVLKMRCNFNYKFQAWVPVQVVE